MRQRERTVSVQLRRYLAVQAQHYETRGSLGSIPVHLRQYVSAGSPVLAEIALTRTNIRHRSPMFVHVRGVTDEDAARSWGPRVSRWVWPGSHGSVPLLHSRSSRTLVSAVGCIRSSMHCGGRHPRSPPSAMATSTRSLLRVGWLRSSPWWWHLRFRRRYRQDRPVPDRFRGNATLIHRPLKVMRSRGSVTTDGPIRRRLPRGWMVISRSDDEPTFGITRIDTEGHHGGGSPRRLCCG